MALGRYCAEKVLILTVSSPLNPISALLQNQLVSFFLKAYQHSPHGCVFMDIEAVPIDARELVAVSAL